MLVARRNVVRAKEAWMNVGRFEEVRGVKAENPPDIR